MDEVSCSFSTTYRFNVYICRKKKYIEHNTDGSAVLPSAEYKALHLFMPMLKGVGVRGWCLEGEDAGMGLHACSGKSLPGVRLRIVQRMSMAGSRYGEKMAAVTWKEKKRQRWI